VFKGEKAEINARAVVAAEHFINNFLPRLLDSRAYPALLAVKERQIELLNSKLEEAEEKIAELREKLGE
jgi:hypothetical protein